MKSPSTFIALAAALAAAPASAAVGVIADAAVVRTMVTGNGEYGGCMAQLSVGIATATNSPKCLGNWVSFSCDAPAGSTAYTSKDMAFRLFDQAELAKATGKHVAVYVDDSKKHNNVCFARRIEVK